MARKKRDYVPKVKGCYECSQRRIDCDGTRPSCAKCRNRGITCSGFVLKYKFLDGFSSRQRSTSGGRSAMLKHSLAQTSAHGPARDKSKVLEPFRDSQAWDDVYWNSSARTYGDGGEWSAQGGGSERDLGRDVSDRKDHADDEEKLSSDVINDLCIISQISRSDADAVSAGPLSPVNLSVLEPWKEFLLTHFSEAIAPEMVVVDDINNGWRRLILPIAWSNTMVMDAVLAVSAFHLSGRAILQPVVNPDKLYALAISQLSNRKDLADRSDEPKQLVVLAIVVLLVSVMVNGMPDFPIVFQMLESAVTAIGGDTALADGGEMGSFLLRQIRKMRVYAAPLVSQDAGKNAILYHARESFDCLYYYYNLYPDHCPTFDLIADIRQQAFNMYLCRVSTNDNETPLLPSCIDAIETFQRSLEAFPEGALGEHILVWPTFIAALECHTSEQRLFFETFLLRQYHRNNFLNIPKALVFLRAIWSQESGQLCWPALIPELRVFIM
ncbi:hypothetical protein HER10_EVM0007265 [Colletotrichum scovillei]|uniref:Acriflavine sensitivity control protein Acr-2 n=1 Tax=Colletotrichum scovillei TaxID=1209932 RepID=A0A9P7UEK7_9PEZI|nr:uncharacterized protein HER10_EVM0007265 [Colletotrichum scovillei]KAF4781101.1 hypothetical protein HER10_EVM0007265 [Colletotrichum scovillei]KAG7045192.1 acriflavine sensitivity control protein Acr-2 [Colletotrichum scovillei]KAG7052354.1 acriflavine sensitivity control protein Acr-2 [Colletotrichum scovillei]KAG7064646.1 acriflavine sensitivity control protein Acr-2 [Colletotrichum scovillei]